MSTADAPHTILDRLATVVDRRPDHPAVVEYGRETYSYARLWQDAQYIANCLIRTGIGKECLVALALPKSYRYLTAVLGTWMAGAAFLPVDTTMPDERIKLILEQSLKFNGGQVIAAITPDSERNRLQALMPELLFVPHTAPADYHPLAMGQVLNSPGQTSETAPDATPDATSDATSDTSPNPSPDTSSTSSWASLAPHDLAYVIFTSGSTGLPKGVLVEHRGIVNLLDEQIDAFKIDSSTRSLFYLSVNFDASISDFGTALLAGATLYIERQEDLTPGPALFDLISQRGITYVDIPPSALRLMDAASTPACLKSMVIGGEVCPRDVVTAFARQLRLVCVYGPTEATVCTSWTLCEADKWQAPLIGRPIKDTGYLVMDAHGKPVKPGTAGELYISGIGLARGYLHQPDLTNERFVTIDGTRYYRSRDTVTETTDGNYIFTGRVDRQLKIRGLLIEPEEIEKHLAEHAQIARAAVLKRSLPDYPERAVLVAFVQAKDKSIARPTSIELREHLSDTLPGWMLPQRYQWLDNLPETTSGKVDIKALAQVALTKTLHAPTKIAPGSQSALTSKIGQAVEILLGYDHLQDTDNFFDLGLDSLAVIELSAALSSLGVEVSPHSIFQHPSVQSLAAHLDTDTDTASGAHDGDRTRSAEQTDALSAAYLRSDILDSPAFIELKALATKAPVIEGLGDTLITGATGFLGARLTADLLRDHSETTGAKIYALIRARDDDGARQRLIDATATLDKSSQETIRQAIRQERLVPIAGDILLHHLGLDSSRYNKLADSLDKIIHLAARVNMVQPYQALKVDNVTGTLNLARLALTSRAKTMHYASTLSVFVSTDQNTGTALESDNLDRTSAIWGGYSQSKWIAEVALRELTKVGLNLKTYRLGLITGDTTSGATTSHDFLAMFVRGLASMGSVPAESLSESGHNLAVDITPVDWAAAAMACIILSDDLTEKSPDVSINPTYHLANGQPLTLHRLVTLFLKHRPETKIVKLNELQARRAGFNQEAAAAYLSLCRLHSDSADFARHRVMDLFQATDIKFDCKNTTGLLSRLTPQKVSPTCPPASDKLIALYIKQAISG